MGWILEGRTRTKAIRTVKRADRRKKMNCQLTLRICLLNTNMGGVGKIEFITTGNPFNSQYEFPPQSSDKKSSRLVLHVTNV